MVTKNNGRKSLWRETLRSMRENFHDWKSLMLIVALFSFADGYVYFTTSAEPYAKQMALYHEILAHHTKDKKQIHEIIEKARAIHTPSASRLSVAALMLIGSIGSFLLTRKFNRYEKIPGEQGDWKRFFYFLWKSVQYLLLLLVLMIPAVIAAVLFTIVVGIIAGIVSGVMDLPKSSGLGFGGVVAGIAIAGLSVAYVYFILRYRLYATLSVAGDKSPLNDSVALMRGNYLRIVREFLILAPIFFPAWVIVFGISFLFYRIIPDHPPIVAVIISALYTVSVVLLMVQMTAFRTVTTRILYDEARAADPNFRLDFEGAKS